MPERATADRTRLFGYEAKLVLDLDGEPFDASHLIEVGRDTGSGPSPEHRGIHIDAGRLLSAIQIELTVRRRVAEAAQSFRS